MKTMRPVLAVLLTLLLLLPVCALPPSAFAALAADSDTQAEALPAFPQGFSFAGVTNKAADGRTLYYAENETSESGLVMGLWLDENGVEVTQTETFPAAQRTGGRKRAEANLPSAYDARSEGLLTPIKLQTGNTCWAFASVACMETNAVKKGIASPSEIDLSEGHLVWFGRNPYFDGETDPRNDGLSASSAESAVNMGGNATYVERALNNFMGPANESDYPVDMSSPEALASSLQSTMTFSDRFARAYDFGGVHRYEATKENIKRAVLTYGAVEQYFYTENAYYTNRVPADDEERLIPATYYYPTDVETSRINHAVVIVGWDDSFSKANFTNDAKPEHDGAWLCRNSWSSAFGNNGYFWMSYENHGCYGAVNAYEINEKDDAITAQYYDGFGSRETLKNTTKAANIFTAAGDHYLRAVSLGAPLNDYTFSVYTGLNATSYPTGGTCVYTQTGNAGGKTVVGLEGKVLLQSGQRYSVVFENLTEVPAEGASKTEGQNDYRFTSDMYQSFFYSDGWTDSNRASKNNVCIRAFEKAQSALPYTVTFACPAGGFETTVTTLTNTVALPEAPNGYAYSFTCNGAAFDGTGVTQDITVRTHCYPVNGAVSASDPCLVEYRCVYCGEEILPSVKQHTLQTTVTAPSAVAPGYTMLACVHGDYGLLSDVVPADGAVGGALGDSFAWQLCGDVLSVVGVGALPDFTAGQPAPWNNETVRAQARRLLVGEGITALGNLALSDLSLLEEITLPATLQTISETALGKGGLTALKTVKVAPENPAFQSENGVLFSADGTVLHLYPANKAGAVYQVPGNVTGFAKYAFAGNRNIAYLDLLLCKPDVLPENFCSNAAALCHVNLPSKTHSIRSAAFYNRSGLLSNLYIRSNVTMPSADVFGNYPKIYLDSNSSSAYSYAQNYNNGNYYRLYSHTHAYTAETVSFPADCDVPAYTVNICECGNFSLTKGDAPGHSFGVWQALNDSEHRRVCANDESHTETAAHTWDDGVVTTKPTCTAAGVKTFTCTVCGAEKTASVDPLKHSFGAWQPYSETEHRRICANDESHTETAAHTWDDGVVTTRPTCTAAGAKTFTCTVCGAEKTVSVDPLNHSFGAWEPYSETEHRRVCVNDESHTETAAHTWDDGVVTTKPTCTAAGVKTFTCTVCGTEKTASVDPLNHSFGVWQPYSETEHRRVCVNDESHTETAAHTWDDGVVTTRPTCTAAGVKTFTCTVCGAEKTAFVDPLNHSFGAWQPYSETEHRRVCVNDESHTETAAHIWDDGVVTAKPSCTSDGEKTFTCTVCAATKSARIAALGHTSPNGSGDCERCGTHLKDVADPNACAYCGETHSGAFGWLVRLIHNLLFRLFGKK